MVKYYAIAKGRNPGIYTIWSIASPLVQGFPGAVYKSFPTKQEAEDFMYSNNPTWNGGKPQNDQATVDVVTAGNSLTTAIMSTVVPVNNYDYAVYTDGSCINGVGGWAIVVVDPVSQQTVSEHHGRTPYNPSTNNKSELYAILVAVSNFEGKSLRIFSDSQYSINCVTIWINSWVKNEWLTSKKEPVENRDLIENIYRQMQGRNITFQHVPAHTNGTDIHSVMNARADTLANQGRFMPFPTNA